MTSTPHGSDGKLCRDNQIYSRAPQPTTTMPGSGSSHFPSQRLIMLNQLFSGQFFFRTAVAKHRAVTLKRHTIDHWVKGHGRHRSWSLNFWQTRLLMDPYGEDF